MLEQKRLSLQKRTSHEWKLEGVKSRQQMRKKIPEYFRNLWTLITLATP